MPEPVSSVAEVVEPVDPPAVDEPTVEAAAGLACTHFRNVAGDADILTPSEMRQKLREVYDDASLSDEPGIARHAREMLAADTDRDAEAFREAVAGFDGACDDLGL